jgi:hypothetical protein
MTQPTPTRREPEDPGTDLAFVGAAAWISAALVGCAFVAWYPARSTGRPPTELLAPTETLREASLFFRTSWLLVWPAAAILLGVTVAPVVLLRARGRRVGLVYAGLAATALLAIPVTWWFCRPA